MPRIGLMPRALIACAALTLPLAATTSQAVPVPVNFAGGGSSPLTITLPQAVTYTVTGASSGGTGGIFVIKDTGGAFAGFQQAVEGTLSYTINGGAPLAIGLGANRTSQTGDIGVNDLMLFRFGGGPALAVGDVVVLSAGSVTSDISTTVPRPPSGQYSTILTDSFGSQIAVGVPEPASAGLLVAASAAGLLRRRRRRGAAA